jgi:acyl dehydratase
VQRPLAFVVAPRLGAREIIAALRTELEPAFVPRRVVHVASLPREATGKLTAAALRSWALAMLAAPPRQIPAARTGGASEGDDEYRIAVDHPAFTGHFPGHPLLPGVVLLSLVMCSLAKRPVLRARLGDAPAIEQVKFLAPVGPGERVQVRLRGQGAGVAFECRAGERIAARGQLGRGRVA